MARFLSLTPFEHLGKEPQTKFPFRIYVPVVSTSVRISFLSSFLPLLQAQQTRQPSLKCYPLFRVKFPHFMER